MDDNFLNLCIHRILTGKQRIRFKDEIFFVSPPTSTDLLLIEENSLEFYENLKEDGVYTRGELERFLVDNNVISENDIKKMDLIRKDIEEFKVQVFLSKYKSNQKTLLKNNIKEFSKQLDLLYDKRYAYDHLSLEGIFFTTKLRLIFSASLRRENGQRYWTDLNRMSQWDDYDPYLDHLFSIYLKRRLTIEQIRYVAKSDPWLLNWSIKDLCAKKLFDCVPGVLNDEQKLVINWSQRYENVMSTASEKMTDAELKDDDIFDGYCIWQNRQSKPETNPMGVSENILNSEEVFILADTPEDANQVYNLNTRSARNLIKQKMDLVDTKGVVSEVEMPDFQAKYNAALMKAQATRGRHG